MTPKETPQEVLKRPYTRNLKPDPSGGFVGTIHEFPGCVAHGETAEEAMQQLDKAAESWLDAALGTGYSVPPPADYSECSGKVALRISRRLHQLASKRAQLEGISLNQLLSAAITEYLGNKANSDLLLSLHSKLSEVASECRSLSAASQQSIHVQLLSAQLKAPNTWDALDWSTKYGTPRRVFISWSATGNESRKSTTASTLIRTRLKVPESDGATRLNSSDEMFVASALNELT